MKSFPEKSKYFQELALLPAEAVEFINQVEKLAEKPKAAAITKYMDEFCALPIEEKKARAEVFAAVADHYFHCMTIHAITKCKQPGQELIKAFFNCIVLFQGYGRILNGFIGDGFVRERHDIDGGVFARYLENALRTSDEQESENGPQIES